MINVLAALALETDIAADEPINVEIADAKVTYAVVQDVKAGHKLSFRALEKEGRLDGFLAALARETALLVKLAADPSHKAELLDLTDSLGL